MAGDRSGFLGGDRSPGRLPCSLHGLSSSPISHPSIVSDVPGRLSSGSSLAARGRGDACQRSLRNRPRSGSRLLQSSLPGGEGVWRLETRDRSLSPERVHPSYSVQDGNSRFCTVICQRGGFSSFPGSERRVLSDPNSSIFEEAIEVHVGGDGLPVPSPVFRTVDCSPGLHQGLRGRVSVGTLQRYQTSTLSGRLVGFLLFGAGSQAGRPVAPLALSRPWDCDKREVGSRALADCEVSRHDHRYQGRQGFSISGASQKIPDGSGELLYHGGSPSSALAGDPRSPGFARAAGSSRSPSDALLAVAFEGALVPRVRPSLSSGAFAMGSETGPVLVDGEGPSVDRGSIRDTCSGSSPVFGRVLFGVGRSPPRSTRVRVVIGPGEVDAHQSSRNEGSFLRPSGIPRRYHRSSCDSDVRQLDGRGVRQQARGHGFPGSMLVGQPPSEIDGESRHPSRYEVSSRTSQCPGRSPQPLRASCRDRVVSPPQVARSLLRVWGNPSIDLFVTSLNAKLPLYCSLVPDPQAVFEDAFRHPWDDLDLYTFPPFPLVGRVIARVRESSRVAMTGRTPLAREGVVRRLTSSTDPTTSRPVLVGQSASAAPLQPLPPRRPRAEPSRVATLKSHFRKSGFLGRAAGVLSGCLRSSTSRLYQSRWQIFCGWCRGRGVAPVNATVPVVVDFLIHLRHDKGLSVSAVKGYSSALNLVLALKDRDLTASREITMLLHSFSRSVDPVELRPPARNVALVLQSLIGAPYEPLRTCEEHFLAQKTLFLLALASSKRIGEFHSLSYRVSHSRGWAEVSFSFVPGFMAKTQDPSFLAPRFEGFTVPAYQMREIIAMGNYVLCGRSGVTLTALLHIVCVVSGCLSPQGVARRRY